MDRCRAASFAILALVSVSCGSDPSAEAKSGQPVGSLAAALTSAQSADGKYISWREHVIDDLEVGGVAIAGSDGLVMADLDKDGFDDIVSVHESDTTYDGVADGHIRLAFGSADPDKWTLATLAEGEEAGAAEDASLADVNGDGYLDIVAACELSHLIYFQNPGENASSERWERVIPEISKNRGSFIRVFFADFDQDGHPEVVAPNKGSQEGPASETKLNPISWFSIDGDPLKGEWTEHVLTEVRVPINSRPIDLDSDGDLDVLGGSRGEARIFWFENLGGDEIAFQEHSIEITDGGRPVKPGITGFNFEFHDLSGDGRLDVVLSEARSNLIWLEQPDDPAEAWAMHRIGTFVPDTMTGFVFTDINDDGRQDLFAGSYSQSPRDHDGEDVTAAGRLGRLGWFEQPADATSEWIRHDVSRRKRGMFDKFVVRDLDSDGDSDMIGTRGNSVPYDGVYWLEQVRTDEPQAAFEQARVADSVEMPLP